jgi:hypothetical protein
MKRRIWVTRLVQWLSVFAVVAPSFAGQARAPQVSQEDARVFKIFTARVQQYVKLQKEVEASLPTLKPTFEAARIAEQQQALARRIAEARHSARQGDIFTHDVSERFRKIIRSAFQGPEGRLARRTIRPDDRSKVIGRLRVNDVYPENMPLTTTPPTLLSKLPQLPKELAYRIVGRDLTLKDTKAGLIVDLIPNAIP